MSDRGAGRRSDAVGCPHGASVVQGPCAEDVLVNGLALARQGDPLQCPGGPPDSLMSGAAYVLVNGRMATRREDKGLHAAGGIQVGSPDVFIGGPTVTILGNQVDSLAACEAAAAGRETRSKRQTYNNCGVECVRQIINRTRTPPVGEETLLDDAMNQELAERELTRYDSGGTSPWGRDTLLERYGVEAERAWASPEAIQEAIAAGKGVITSHDSDKLYPNGGSTGGHALLVTGVKYDEQGRVAAYRVNDSGTGKCGALIPAEQFERSLRWGRPMNVTKQRIW